MKFRCERDLLVEALSAAGRAVTNRGSLQVLAGLHLALSGNELVVTGSDLDLTISYTIEVSGDTDGVVVIPAKLVADVVRALPAGSVDISIEGEEARIVAPPSEFSLRTYAAADFPTVASPDGDGVTLDAAAFREALRQVVPAASSDDARPLLTGVLMAAEGDGLRLVATDSYRLSVRDLQGTSVLSEGQTVLVPSRALNELSRTIGDSDKLTLTLAANDATFSVGKVRVTTRLIEGEFPNYRGLIPVNHPNILTVDREVLLDAVKRVKLLAQESTPIRLAMTTDGLELVAVTQDVGQAHETLEAKYGGEDLTVAFNPDYLIDGIEVAPGDEITLETVDALKPVLLRSVGTSDFTYLLMPVRVS